jgi:ABC-2 type transport system ATP-binding protein
MIEVNQLTKRYGDVLALNNVSIKVNKGEVLGFLGPNGAGKTTTMKILTCFMAPTSGHARVAGHDIFEESLEVRKKIGYLPENVPLYRDMTVRDYLDHCARLRGVPKEQREERIDDVIKKTRLEEAEDTLIHKCSKGFRQRVGLAQALVHNPPVLILDEPTIGLDPHQIIETRKLIKGLARDHTVVLSSHILPEVSMTCERVIIINKGEIVAVDTPDNLTRKLQQSQKIQMQVRRAGEDAGTRIQEIEGVTHVSTTRLDGGGFLFTVESRMDKDVREDLASLAVSSGWGLLEMKQIELSLEQIFLQLTTTEEGINN